MRIRPYVAADWPRLCAVHDAARRDELRLSAGTAAFLPLFDTAGDEGLFAGELWVAELNGVIEGFIAYSAEEICWLYVSPDAYRRGIGRALLRHAIAAGGAVLKTEVLEGNEPAL